MTDQKNESSLTDDAIVDIAQSFDQFILEMGEKHKPSGIEFASIILGRLIIFSKHVDCLNTFHELLGAVSKLKESEPLSKTEDLQ